MPNPPEKKFPIDVQVGLGIYFTAPSVNTQAIKYIHLASRHVVGWLVGHKKIGT